MIRTLDQWRACLASAVAVHPDLPVVFDYGGKVGPLDSWRGDYAKVTITTLDDWEGSLDPPFLTARQLLDDADEVLAGKVLTGHKGGEYRHDGPHGGRVELYADDHGRCEWNRAYCLVIGDDEWVVATDPGFWIDPALVIEVTR